MTGCETPWDAPGMAAACEEMWATDYEVDMCRRLAHLMAMQGRWWRTAADIGCGTGRLYPAVRDCLAYAGGYLGIDASSHMLAVARRRYPAAQFRLGNLLDGVPYPPQQFDLVVCSAVLGHLEQRQLIPALAELWRITRQALFFTLWMTDEPEPRLGVDLGNMRKVFYPLPMVWAALGALTEHRGAVRSWPLSDGTWVWLVRR